jgi:hypothetical protein
MQTLRRMVRVIVAIALAVISSAPVSSAKTTRAQNDAARFRAALVRDGTSADDAEWISWNTFYYANPQPARTVPGIRFFSQKGALRKAQQPLAVFFGRVFAQNRNSLGKWVDELRRGPEDQQFFAGLALWFSDVTDRDRWLDTLGENGSSQLRSYINDLRGDKPPDLTSIEVRQPLELDMLWASFFATGDTRYVVRVIQVLAPSSGQRSDATVAAAARWSLTSNARAHSLVLEVCRKRASQQPEIADVLNEVIAKAESEQPKTEPSR